MRRRNAVSIGAVTINIIISLSVFGPIQTNLTALFSARDTGYDPLRTRIDPLAESGVKP